MKIICFFIILIILILIFYIKYNYYDIKEDFLTYKRCDKYLLTKHLQDIFSTYDINKTYGDNYDIWLPCGYSNGEIELKTLQPNNNKQAIFAISGMDRLAGKNYLWEHLKIKYGDKAKKIMPMTYILENKNDMNKFIKEFNPNKKYILKKIFKEKKD